MPTTYKPSSRIIIKLTESHCRVMLPSKRNIHRLMCCRLSAECSSHTTTQKDTSNLAPAGHYFKSRSDFDDHPMCIKLYVKCIQEDLSTWCIGHPLTHVASLHSNPTKIPKVRSAQPRKNERLFAKAMVRKTTCIHISWNWRSRKIIL